MEWQSAILDLFWKTIWKDRWKKEYFLAIINNIKYKLQSNNFYLILMEKMWYILVQYYRNRFLDLRSSSFGFDTFAKHIKMHFFRETYPRQGTHFWICIKFCKVTLPPTQIIILLTTICEIFYLAQDFKYFITRYLLLHTCQPDSPGCVTLMGLQLKVCNRWTAGRTTH